MATNNSFPPQQSSQMTSVLPQLRNTQLFRHSTYVASAITNFNCWQRWRIPLRIWAEKPCAQAISWLTLLLIFWALMYSTAGDNVAPSGDLFRLMALVIVAFLMGVVTDKYLRLPGLLGMLVTGIVCRNIGFYYPAEGRFKELTILLKQTATTVGMIRAGMRLVPDAIYATLHSKHGLQLAGLALMPSFLEAMAVAVASYCAIGYSTLWALSLGFLLCPNSPSVITLPMEKLMMAGYGERKSVGALVCGAAGMDVAFSVSMFDLCLSLLFQKVGLTPTQIFQKGTIDISIDLWGGFVIGLIAGLIPVKDDVLAVWKRAFAAVASGLFSIISGPKLGLPGTGPLSCIVSSFVAAMLWKMQIPLQSQIRVPDIIQRSWILLCPMLFAFTGSDVDISTLDLYSAQWMISIVLLSIFVRLLSCFLVLFRSQFNWKEKFFIGLIFQGKATNQAALAPNMLYKAWTTEDPESINLAMKSLTVAVLAILICTPLAHLGATLGGPCLLAKDQLARDSLNTVRDTIISEPSSVVVKTSQTTIRSN